MIEDLVDEILTRHASAEVLFVHGWNVVQPRCDIGVGATLGHEDDAAAQDAALTAAPGYVATRLATFRHRCAAVGLLATYGERYPAKHRNNLVQLFRRAAARSRAGGGRLSEWAAAGRTHAIQLELGIPLRWPGAARERFLTVAADVFGSPSARPTAAGTTWAPIAQPVAHATTALEFYDPGCGIGLSSSVAVDRRRSLTTARLLLFSGARRAALFVGESADAGSLARGGPCFERNGDELRLVFDGHLLELEDGSAYTRLEDAFALSALVPARADLTFRPTTGASHGRVSGWVRSPRRSWRVDCHGFARSVALERAADLEGPRLELAASFGASLALVARSREPHRVRRSRPEGDDLLPVTATAADLAADGGTVRRFTLSLGDGESLSLEPLSWLVVLRPLGPGRTAHTTIGVARFRNSGPARGFGFFEYSRPLESVGKEPGGV